MRTTKFLAMVLTLLILPAMVRAEQLVPSGGDQFVADENASEAVACGDSTGAFVVVWRAYNPSTRAESVVGQRFDALGSRSGTKFQVSALPQGLSNGLVAVGCKPSGAFVVAWARPVTKDTSTIFAQQYDRQGRRKGTAIRVSTASASASGFPAIAIDAQGGFVVAWGNAASTRVLAQRFDAEGGLLGPVIRPDLASGETATMPAVAFDSQGNLILAWTGAVHVPNFTYPQVHGQRFDGAGVPMEAPFQPFLQSEGDMSAPVVLPDAVGGFQLVWGVALPDTSLLPCIVPAGSIDRQQFDAAAVTVGTLRGSPVPQNFQVNVLSAALPDGHLLSAWTDFERCTRCEADCSLGGCGPGSCAQSTASLDGDGESVVGHLYGLDGKVTSTRRLNGTKTGDQSLVYIGTAGTKFLVLWQGQGPAGKGLYVRRFSVGSSSMASR